MLSVIFWIGGPWFLLFTWSAIGAAAKYQFRHLFAADPQNNSDRGSSLTKPPPLTQLSLFLLQVGKCRNVIGQMTFKHRSRLINQAVHLNNIPGEAWHQIVFKLRTIPVRLEQPFK